MAISRRDAALRGWETRRAKYGPSGRRGGSKSGGRAVGVAVRMPSSIRENGSKEVVGDVRRRLRQRAST